MACLPHTWEHLDLKSQQPLSPISPASGAPGGRREAWRAQAGSTGVVITRAEASEPVSSGSPCPAHEFQIHSTDQLLAAQFVL